MEQRVPLPDVVKSSNVIYLLENGKWENRARTKDFNRISPPGLNFLLSSDGVSVQYTNPNTGAPVAYSHRQALQNAFSGRDLSALQQPIHPMNIDKGTFLSAKEGTALIQGGLVVGTLPPLPDVVGGPTKIYLLEDGKWRHGAQTKDFNRISPHGLNFLLLPDGVSVQYTNPNTGALVAYSHRPALQKAFSCRDLSGLQQPIHPININKGDFLSAKEGTALIQGGQVVGTLPPLPDVVGRPRKIHLLEDGKWKNRARTKDFNRISPTGLNFLLSPDGVSVQYTNPNTGALVAYSHRQALQNAFSGCDLSALQQPIHPINVSKGLFLSAQEGTALIQVPSASAGYVIPDAEESQDNNEDAALIAAAQASLPTHASERDVCYGDSSAGAGTSQAYDPLSAPWESMGWDPAPYAQEGRGGSGFGSSVSYGMASASGSRVTRKRKAGEADLENPPPRSHLESTRGIAELSTVSRPRYTYSDTIQPHDSRSGVETYQSAIEILNNLLHLSDNPNNPNPQRLELQHAKLRALLLDPNEQRSIEVLKDDLKKQARGNPNSSQARMLWLITHNEQNDFAAVPRYFPPGYPPPLQGFVAPLPTQQALGNWADPQVNVPLSKIPGRLYTYAGRPSEANPTVNKHLFLPDGKMGAIEVDFPIPQEVLNRRIKGSCDYVHAELNPLLLPSDAPRLLNASNILYPGPGQEPPHQGR